MDAGCMTRDEPMVDLWMSTEEGAGCAQVDFRLALGGLEHFTL